MTIHAEIANLIPGYALDCLDDDELVLVSEHLADCQECQTELRRYNPVVHHLPLVAPVTQPPSTLHSRLTSQPQIPPVRHLPRTSSKNFIRWGVPLFIGAGLILVLILAAGNLLLWRQVNQPAQLNTLSAITLTGTQAAPNATGLIILSLDGEYGTLVVDHLPPLDTEHQYQLWLIHNDDRASGGVFSVSDEGYGTIEILSPEPLDSFSAFGISIEPVGGSPGPTGQKVLGSTLN